ncbi:MAG: 4Fe-4S dicluster domain-containing protein [Thermodesulfobacteriota bacterium]
MGHLIGHDQPYLALQARLGQKVQGAPASPTLLAILGKLFTPQEAELASRLPHNLVALDDLARRLGQPEQELDERLSAMAQRGVVFDLELGGRRYFTLPPVVIGFFEFVFMRSRDELPVAELAALFEQYFYENDGALLRTVGAGQTQLVRTLVQEEALPRESPAEVLDWERATRIVASAEALAVGLCQCQHLAEHLGQACAKPREVCLSFDFAAASLVRAGHARAIDRERAQAILAESKAAGLAQIGDNVQRRVSFICNCCGCCCHIMRGIRGFGAGAGSIACNWIMEVDRSRCQGCGECAKACPVSAIRLEKVHDGQRTRAWAVRDETFCLGCGVCAGICKTGGAKMRPREQRLLVPETIFEQRLAMAIERGKLADLLADDPGRLSHRALGKVVAALEKCTPFQAAMAAAPLKSAFLKLLAAGARRQAGPLADLFA